MSSNRYHKFNTYDQLRTVVLGSYFLPEYFEFISDQAVRYPLMTIAKEINEDLNYFEQVLKEKKVNVLRPNLPTCKEFQDYFFQHQEFLPAPLQPRNHHFVLGQQCYQTNDKFADPHVVALLEKYHNIVDLSIQNKNFFSDSTNKVKDSCFNSTTNTWYRRQKYNELAGPDWPKFEEYVQGIRATQSNIAIEMQQFESEFVYDSREFFPLSGPNVIPIDDAVIVDSNEYCNYADWLKQHVPVDTQIIPINTTAGHTDGCFMVIGKKIIIGIDPLIDYAHIFPGYKLIPVPPINYQDHLHWSNHLKSKIKGAWWVPGQEHNQSFTNFVDTYLQRFTGFSAETLFDVNILALDETTVFVANDRTPITDALNKHGIETIEIPWRHRFFVDCGLHCITLDLDRTHGHA